MKFIKKYLFSAGFILLGILLPPKGGAMERTPLPVFEVTTVDGVTTKSDQLPPQGQWLLIYVQPHCLPCESLLGLLKIDPGFALSRKIIVVTGGTVNDVKELTGKFPELASASWYVDPLKSAFLQLKLQGVPVVLGVRNDSIEWSISGGLSDKKDLKSILTTWLDQ